MGHEPSFLRFQPEAGEYQRPPRTPSPVRDDPRALPVPPVHLLLGHVDGEQYLEWGQLHADNMRGILDQAGFVFTPGARILDFGCGAARLMRWLLDVAEGCSIWGVDIRAEHIFWCQENLSPPFNFLVSTIHPHLPFEDRHFDLVYAGSVFTHIDDLADAWLLEVRRVLRPGGLFYVTVHDNRTIEMLQGELREHWLGRLFNDNDAYRHYVAEDSFGMFTIGRGEASQVFYDRSHFLAMTETLFETVSVTEKAYGYQTAILLRRKP